MTKPARKSRPLSSLEAQRYVNTTIEAIELIRLARDNPGVEVEDLLHLMRGDGGYLDYASYGEERPSMSLVDTWNVDESCPRQWPAAGNMDRESWNTYCNADPVNIGATHPDANHLPAYYFTADRWGNDVCEDCRLWRWWAWIEQEFGWDLHGELFAKRGPASRVAEVIL